MVARLLAVALGLLLFLPALADATPPDPTWIGGLSDEADYDDVIILVNAAPSPPPTESVHSLDLHWTPVWVIPALDEPLPSPATPPSPLARGPPLS
jgi:hypothetical protein